MEDNHPEPASVATKPELEAVRQFWSRNPLYAGESQHPPGTRQFFEDHERVTLHEHSGSIDPIFTRDAVAGRTVLDVGCGVGFWVDRFCRTGAVVSACDLTETAVDLTSRRLELFGLKADVRSGNAEDLPYPESVFHHVNCQGVIHHTPDTARCLREFHRVLRPGGTLCFSVYNKTLPLRWRWLYRMVRTLTQSWLGLPGRGRENMLTATTPEELVRRYDGIQNPIGKAYTREELHQMLSGRFSVLECKRFGLPRRALPFPLSDGLHRSLSRVLGLMVVLRCRRI